MSRLLRHLVAPFATPASIWRRCDRFAFALGDTIQQAHFLATLDGFKQLNVNGANLTPSALRDAKISAINQAQESPNSLLL